MLNHWRIIGRCRMMLWVCQSVHIGVGSGRCVHATRVSVVAQVRIVVSAVRNTHDRSLLSITDSVTDLFWQERPPPFQARDTPNVKFQTSSQLRLLRNIVPTGSENKSDRADTRTIVSMAALSSSADAVMASSWYSKSSVCSERFVHILPEKMCQMYLSNFV